MNEHNDTGSTPKVAYEAPQAEGVLRRAIDLIEAARPMPLSNSSMINKEEVLELLNDCVERLPDELRAARWLLKEREEYLARVRREGEEIMEVARTRAERMVQKTEVVKAAEREARRVVEIAEEQSRRMRLETEDYCDQKLASFEGILAKTMRVAAQGRSRLQGDPLTDLASMTGEQPAVEHGVPENPVFDQDQVAESPTASVPRAEPL